MEGAAAQPSYAHGASDVSLLGTTIGADLRATARRVPDRPALVSRHQDIRLTYAEYDAQVDRVAKALHRRRPTSAATASGCGARTAPSGRRPVRDRARRRDPRQPQPGLPLLGARVRADAVRRADADRRPLVQDLGLRGDGRRAWRRPVETLERAVFFDTDAWTELLAGGDDVGDDALAEREAELDPSDPINIQYTSGTTGFPKGATLSHHNILNNGFFVGEGCAITEQDSICVPVPYYHCFGMVMGNLAATTHGACIVLPGEAFEPGPVLEAVADERCTALYGVPTMFIAELADPDFERPRPVARCAPGSWPARRAPRRSCAA